ncbi:hypothetical protein [Paenibacillus sp. FSL E2-0178]|uniref:hypothetical protein n=1 Tax=Paenibacillus sp. FSL E2-0178 TaxID=2921361 RepID=UPI003159927A
MIIKFTQDEVREIVKKHVDTLGFNSVGVKIVYQDRKDYEYFGDPTRQDRREIKVRHFDCIEVEIKPEEMSKR